MRFRLQRAAAQTVPAARNGVVDVAEAI